MPDLTDAEILARLQQFAATHKPTPATWQPEPPMAEHHAEERKADRQWASAWDMDRLAERRAS